MKYDMSFQERAGLAMEMLSKQRSFTLDEKRAQAMWVKLGQQGETFELYLEKYKRGEFDYIYK